jgi:hypothetical protein
MRTAGLGLLAILLIACVDQPASALPPSRSAGGEAPTPTLAPSVVAEAADFRRAFGLRSDAAWIATVAADPQSQAGLADFGVPLMPFEYAELMNRARQGTDNLETIANYGAAFPDAYAGVFVDEQTRGIPVVLFTGDRTPHIDRLKRLLPDGAIFDVRQANWSTRQLEAFADQVRQEAAWFGSVGAELRTVDTSTIENRNHLRFRATDPQLAAVIEQHFGSPEWLVADWRGPPPWPGARGTLLIVVHRPAGGGVAGLPCLFASVDPRADADGGSTTRADGTCQFDAIPAVEYRVEITTPDEIQSHVLATSTVTVRPDALSRIDIVVEP